MRVAVCDNQVPFVKGGAEALREELMAALRRTGHEVELFALPYRWYPTASLVRSLALWHLLELDGYGKTFDRAIALRFPAYLVRHPQRVVLLQHQHPTSHDPWNTAHDDGEYGEHAPRLRDLIHQLDRNQLPQARRVFAGSPTVAARLAERCGLAAEVLCPPVPRSELGAARLQTVADLELSWDRFAQRLLE